jgi:hypothetical protein
MSDDIKDAGGNGAPPRFSLSRWSERKRANARGAAVVETAEVPAVGVVPPMPVGAATSAAGADNAASAVSPVAENRPLPALETLTFDSDFTVFMAGNVDESVRRAALRTLLHDPRFNVMDGLDTYIDDYSIPDPISPEILAQLRHSIDTLNPVFPAEEGALPVAVNEVPAAAPVRMAGTVAAADAQAAAEVTAQVAVQVNAPVATQQAACAAQPADVPSVAKDAADNT